MGITDDIEAKLAKLKELRDVEAALGRLAAGPPNNAYITRMEATDGGSSERSVNLQFTSEETTAIFKCATEAVVLRQKMLQDELSA